MKRTIAEILDKNMNLTRLALSSVLGPFGVHYLENISVHLCMVMQFIS